MHHCDSSRVVLKTETTYTRHDLDTTLDEHLGTLWQDESHRAREAQCPKHPAAGCSYHGTRKLYYRCAFGSNLSVVGGSSKGFVDG